MIKQSIFAALAVGAVIAAPAIAQQAAPVDKPAASQTQQRSEADDPGRDEGGRRWRREFRRDEDRMGPGMMTRPRMGQMMCGPQGGRFAERMIDRIERATKPTAEQKPAFDKLKEAATKAAETVRAACPTEPPLTPPGRLANAEKRLTAMLDAVRTVRPAMEAYYSSLSDEQKARLLMSRRAMMERREGGPERDGWREQDRGERRFERFRDRSNQDNERQRTNDEGERGDIAEPL